MGGVEAQRGGDVRASNVIDLDSGRPVQAQRGGAAGRRAEQGADVQGRPLGEVLGLKRARIARAPRDAGANGHAGGEDAEADLAARLEVHRDFGDENDGHRPHLDGYRIAVDFANLGLPEFRRDLQALRSSFAVA